MKAVAKVYWSTRAAVSQTRDPTKPLPPKTSRCGAGAGCVAGRGRGEEKERCAAGLLATRAAPFPARRFLSCSLSSPLSLSLSRLTSAPRAELLLWVASARRGAWTWPAARRRRAERAFMGERALRERNEGVLSQSCGAAEHTLLTVAAAASGEVTRGPTRPPRLRLHCTRTAPLCSKPDLASVRTGAWVWRARTRRRGAEKASQKAAAAPERPAFFFFLVLVQQRRASATGLARPQHLDGAAPASRRVAPVGRGWECGGEGGRFFVHLRALSPRGGDRRPPFPFRSTRSPSSLHFLITGARRGRLHARDAQPWPTPP